MPDAPHHLLIPGAMQVTFNTGAQGRAIQVTTVAAVPDTLFATAALADAIFSSVGALWTAQFAPLIPTTNALLGVSLRDLRQEGLPIVSSVGASRAGTAAAADMLPRQIAACLTIRTARAGKKYRGRMYWGGFAETANGADNHMTTAMKTAADAFSTGFIAAYNVQGIQLAVGHRPTAFDLVTGLPISPGLGFATPSTQVVCRDNVWDNQRRRAG